MRALKAKAVRRSMVRLENRGLDPKLRAPIHHELRRRSRGVPVGRIDQLADEVADQVARSRAQRELRGVRG